MKTTSHNLESYRAEFLDLAREALASLAKLGDFMNRASKDLSNEDFLTLESDVMTIYTRADIKAARAIALGELEPELFSRAIKSSKVMALSRTDQLRLLDPHETFEVYADNGDVVAKSWAGMSPNEKNRLLGPKGSFLHRLDEQTQPRPEVGQVYTTTVYVSAAISADAKVLELTGTKGGRGEIELERLVRTLGPDAAAELVAYLTA